MHIVRLVKRPKGYISVPPFPCHAPSDLIKFDQVGTIFAQTNVTMEVSILTFWHKEGKPTTVLFCLFVRFGKVYIMKMWRYFLSLFFASLQAGLQTLNLLRRKLAQTLVDEPAMTQPAPLCFSSSPTPGQKHSEGLVTKQASLVTVKAKRPYHVTTYYLPRRGHVHNSTRPSRLTACPESVLVFLLSNPKAVFSFKYRHLVTEHWKICSLLQKLQTYL